MTENERALMIRAAAAEHIITLILAELFSRHDNPETALREFAKTAVESLDTATIPGADPILSDIYTQETADAVAAIFERVTAIPTK